MIYPKNSLEKTFQFLTKTMEGTLKPFKKNHGLITWKKPQFFDFLNFFYL